MPRPNNRSAAIVDTSITNDRQKVELLKSMYVPNSALSNIAEGHTMSDQSPKYYAIKDDIPLSMLRFNPSPISNYIYNEIEINVSDKKAWKELGVNNNSPIIRAALREYKYPTRNRSNTNHFKEDLYNCINLAIEETRYNDSVFAVTTKYHTYRNLSISDFNSPIRYSYFRENSINTSGGYYYYFGDTNCFNTYREGVHFAFIVTIKPEFISIFIELFCQSISNSQTLTLRELPNPKWFKVYYDEIFTSGLTNAQIKGHDTIMYNLINSRIALYHTLGIECVPILGGKYESVFSYVELDNLPSIISEIGGTLAERNDNIRKYLSKMDSEIKRAST